MKHFSKQVQLNVDYTRRVKMKNLMYLLTITIVMSLSLTKKQNYDETTNGTYVYYPETREGWINCSVFSGWKLLFSISGDKLSSQMGSDVYTKD